MPEGSCWSHGTAAIGEQRLVAGDCREVMGAMEAGSVDLVVTSPPYNLNLAYTVYDDARSEEDYLAWLLNVARAAKRVLSPRFVFPQHRRVQ